MEDQPRQGTATSRPSALPRPQSKLPVPRPTSLRTAPSRESLAAGGARGASSGGALRNPKLRPVPSRDRLADSASDPVASTASAASRPLSHRPSQTRLAARQSTSHASPKPASSSNGLANNAQKLRNTTAPASQHTPSSSRSAFPRSLATRKPSLQRLSSPSLSTADNSPLASPRASEPTLRPAPALVEDGIGESIDTDARPSLSDRTVETLSQLPSSPALKGRVSSFYDLDLARRNVHSRPSSSHRSDASNRASSRTPSRPSSRPDVYSRPTSSSGLEDAAQGFRSASNPLKKAPIPTMDGTPSRERLDVGLQKTPSRSTLRGPARPSARTQSPSISGIARETTPSPEKPLQEMPTPKFGSKTAALRSVRSKPSLNGLKKPSISAPDRKPAAKTPRKVSSASRGSSATSCEGAAGSGASNASTSTALTTDSIDVPAPSARKSSSALREQIAKAKAAKRAASRETPGSGTQQSPESAVPLIPTDTTFDFGLSTDPFGQQRDSNATSKILKGKVASARTSGRLNIAAMGLKEIPSEVMNMYSLDSVGTTDGAWAESVDLSRFVAADNELEMLEESLFPDIDQDKLADNEDAPSCMFGGLETLDLHGNMLIALPMGMRRLSLLTSLNLSQNRLANNCLEVISLITSLKDLKLGGNLFYGPLDPCFSGLTNLEILDLHGNNIASLPSNFGNLTRLRILNVSENCLETLPFEILSTLPLTELIARKNQLSGALVGGAVSSFPTLHSLDVSANQLTQLVSDASAALEMPALQQLFVSMNRLQGLPDISSWTSLIILSADENNINAMPEGMTALDKLRTVDFSSNDIRIIPPEISRMDNLAMLRLSGNPLRDKKFCSMSTEEIKSTLAARLEPPPSYDAPPDETQEAKDPAPEPSNSSSKSHKSHNSLQPPSAGVGEGSEDLDDSRSDLDDYATPPTSAPHSPTRSRSHTLTNLSTWPVRPGGLLDRSNTQSSALHPVVCSKVAAANAVREVQLHHNLFTAMPDSLSFFAETLSSLSLAHNKLVGETYLGGPSGNEDLDLPALKELNLTSNHITSLVPLAVHLRAPQLQKLDVSLNRIPALPPGHQLLDAFPQLTVLLISNNHLIDLDPENIRGLRIVDAANNDIAHLNPRIGLLGGPSGLERLEVAGNRFRVPRWNVLERGTEATLRWLRGRVPVAEMAAWRNAEGYADGDDDEADLD